MFESTNWKKNYVVITWIYVKTLNYSEAAVKRCSVEKLFWKFSEIFKENVRRWVILSVKFNAGCSEQWLRQGCFLEVLQTSSDLLHIADCKRKYFFVENVFFFRFSFQSVQREYFCVV